MQGRELLLLLLFEVKCGAGSTRLFSCESAKVANNFVETTSESSFQLSSNRLTLSYDEANRMHEYAKNDPHPPSFIYIEQGCGSVFVL